MPGRTIAHHNVRPSLRRQRSSSEVLRWAEFGKVSAGLIHELSTPLAAASLTLDELQREHPDRLLRQVRRDLNQLQSYILAARYQLKGESLPTSFYLSNAISQVALIMAPRARESGVKIKVMSKDKIKLYGDVVKFHQVISNLVVNSIESYGHDSELERIVQIKCYKEEANAIISVKDNGSGIRKENMTKIFTPFYSTKSENKRGLGVGLDLVKRYVENDFRGSIKVKSTMGKGTEFILKLPLK